MMVLNDMIAVVPEKVRRLLAEGLQELVQSGFTTTGGWLLLNYEQRIFWVEEGGEPVGVATYMVAHEWGKAVNSLVYVAPGHRRKGCFRKLLEHLRAKAAADRLAGVELSTHVHNTQMQAAARACGMEPTFIRYATPALSTEERARMRAAREAI